jgi:hypothetical protein
MNRLRRSEYVPPMAEADARRLRGVPSSWEQAVAESAVEGLQKRADGLVVLLERAGRERDAAEMRCRIALLQRADQLHRHASAIETAAGLYRALAIFAQDQEQQEPSLEHERIWAQAGLLEDPLTVMHGPAFRETAALRNRAYRLLAAGVARLGRATTRAAR